MSSNTRTQETTLQAETAQIIRAFIAESPLNRLTNIDNSPIWEEPLVAFADGDDPVFDLLKRAVSPAHMVPREVLAVHLASLPPASAPDLSHAGVISWVVPVARKTRLSNRRMTERPSKRWNNTRFQGEEVCDAGPLDQEAGIHGPLQRLRPLPDGRALRSGHTQAPGLANTASRARLTNQKGRGRLPTAALPAS